MNKKSNNSRKDANKTFEMIQTDGVYFNCKAEIQSGSLNDR